MLQFPAVFVLYFHCSPCSIFYWGVVFTRKSIDDFQKSRISHFRLVITAHLSSATDPPAEDPYRAAIAIGDFGLSRDAAAGASHPGERSCTTPGALERSVEPFSCPGMTVRYCQASAALEPLEDPVSCHRMIGRPDYIWS